MKQPQYQPVPVEQQILLIYAGNSGALDDFPPQLVPQFEKAFLAELRDRMPDAAKEVLTSKDLSEGLKAKLAEVLKNVKQQVLASRGAKA